MCLGVNGHGVLHWALHWESSALHQRALATKAARVEATLPGETRYCCESYRPWVPRAFHSDSTGFRARIDCSVKLDYQ